MSKTTDKSTDLLPEVKKLVGDLMKIGKHWDIAHEEVALAIQTAAVEATARECMEIAKTERDDFDAGISEWCASEAIVEAIRTRFKLEE